MPGWFSGEVIANKIKVHYYRTGGDKPPLVLSSGMTDYGLCWTRAARVLEKDYDVIMADARGHGLSEAPETGYGVEDRAADLAGLVRALGLDKPVLMGHSMGADTTAFMVGRYPDLAGCAVLEDPPWYEGILSAELRQAMAAEWRARLVERKTKTLEEVLADGRERHPTWSDAEFGPWAEAKLQVSMNALQVLTGLRPDWRETAARIACPTLLVTGDPERGALVTPEVAAELSEVCPHLQVAHIAGAGHNIRRERFELYVDAVTSFLKERA
jgi:N-formylmaleamate deformylase